MAEQEFDEHDGEDENIPSPGALPVASETLKEPLKPQDPDTPLDELLEAERIELMQVSSMMHCLKEVLMYSDDDDGTMHSDVAGVSSRLLDDSISRLEIIKGSIKERLAILPHPSSPK